MNTIWQQIAFDCIACHQTEKEREGEGGKNVQHEKKLDTHMMFVTISQLVIDYVISAHHLYIDRYNWTLDYFRRKFHRFEHWSFCNRNHVVSNLYLFLLQLLSPFLMSRSSSSELPNRMEFFECTFSLENIHIERSSRWYNWFSLSTFESFLYYWIQYTLLSIRNRL